MLKLREKLFPIVSTILMCATNNIALRGSDSSAGNFNDLLKFRIESGDIMLKNHLENSATNAIYVSHRAHNDLLKICQQELRKMILNDVKESVGFRF